MKADLDEIGIAAEFGPSEHWLALLVHRLQGSRRGFVVHPNILKDLFRAEFHVDVNGFLENATVLRNPFAASIRAIELKQEHSNAQGIKPTRPDHYAGLRKWAYGHRWVVGIIVLVLKQASYGACVGG